jgi:hypothetical protein
MNKGNISSPYYIVESQYPVTNTEKAQWGEEAFAEALSDFPILMNITYGKRQKDIDHLVFASHSVIMNECKNTKENFHMFYSWFLSHVVDRFADGLPVAQYYARTFGYSVKSIVFTLTIPRLNTEPIVKKALNGLRIHVIETEEQLVDKDSLEKWHKPVRGQFLSVINNQVNNTRDPIDSSTVTLLSADPTHKKPTITMKKIGGNPMTEITMYKEAIKSWNPFVGCKHDCIYCESSFKRQMKRRKRQCMDCYNFEPHFHAQRLSNSLPRTTGTGFIFCCDMGDIAFCKPEWVERILSRIRDLTQRTFLIQSKNPDIFNHYQFPKNVLLGTTIETNRDDLYEGMSKAPLPSQRYSAMARLQYPRKVVTIEPVIDFDADVMVKWIEDISPEACYIGYDSKKNDLPEPELYKVETFIEMLGEITNVRIKTFRNAWWEGQ